MLPLSPALFVAAATALIGDFRCDPPSSCGPVTEDGVERDGLGHFDSRATAAFIAHVGYWSHHRGRGKSDWPFPLDADCDALATLASQQAVLNEDRPDTGTICLHRPEGDQRFSRASIVLWTEEVEDTGRASDSYECGMIEGGAILLGPFGAPANRRNGFETRVLWVRRTQVRFRPAEGDRFIKWVDLDQRNVAACPQHRRAA
jgi:hypothetical protein